MKNPTTVLRRPGTMGWLVLTSQLPEMGLESTATQRLVELVDQTRSVLLLEMQEEVEDNFPLWIVELIGQDLIRLMATADRVEQARSSWLDSGLIFTCGGKPIAWQEFMSGHLFRGYPEEILSEGSVLVASGPMAAALGTWRIQSRGADLEPGLGWLEGGLVLPGQVRPAAEPAALELLEGATPAYALGLPEGAMLALGPAGEVEVWSDVKPAIVLGRGWLTSEA